MSVNFNDQTDQIYTTSGILKQNNTGGFIVASGNNSVNKPAATGNSGLIRYNTDNNVLEAVINGVYYNLAIVPTGPTALVAGFLPINGSLPMTGTLGLVSGSSSAPGLYFTGNTSTGLFSPNANILSITSSGTEVLRVNANTTISTYTQMNLVAGGTSVTPPSGDNSTNIATTAFVANSAVPAGTIIMYGASTPPSGYLECNGAVCNTSTYANLFAAIGYNFGGSGTNFYLPDMRGMFARGWDDGRGIDAGRAFGTTQADIFAQHTHGVNESPHEHGMLNNANNGFGNHTGSGENGPTGSPSGVWQNFNSGPASTGITINPTGGAETRPKNVALMYCIKY